MGSASYNKLQKNGQPISWRFQIHPTIQIYQINDYVGNCLFECGNSSKFQYLEKFSTLLIQTHQMLIERLFVRNGDFYYKTKIANCCVLYNMRIILQKSQPTKKQMKKAQKLLILLKTYAKGEELQQKEKIQKQDIIQKDHKQNNSLKLKQNLINSLQKVALYQIINSTILQCKKSIEELIQQENLNFTLKEENVYIFIKQNNIKFYSNANLLLFHQNKQIFKAKNYSQIQFNEILGRTLSKLNQDKKEFIVKQKGKGFLTLIYNSQKNDQVSSKKQEQQSIQKQQQQSIQKQQQQSIQKQQQQSIQKQQQQSIQKQQQQSSQKQQQQQQSIQRQEQQSIQKQMQQSIQKQMQQSIQKQQQSLQQQKQIDQNQISKQSKYKNMSLINPDTFTFNQFEVGPIQIKVKDMNQNRDIVDFIFEYLRVVHNRIDNDEEIIKLYCIDYLNKNTFLQDEKLNIKIRLGQRYMEYTINGKLIALSVIVLTQKYFISEYFFYLPEFKDFDIGIFSILIELEYAKRIQKHFPKFKYHTLGYSTLRTKKMEYKLQFKGTQIQCPSTYLWKEYNNQIRDEIHKQVLQICPSVPQQPLDFSKVTILLSDMSVKANIVCEEDQEDELSKILLSNAQILGNDLMYHFRFTNGQTIQQGIQY